MVKTDKNRNRANIKLATKNIANNDINIKLKAHGSKSIKKEFVIENNVELIENQANKVLKKILILDGLG